MSPDHGFDLCGSPAPSQNLQAASASSDAAASAIMLFRIVVNGRGMYYGFFKHACDAIWDALDHGASSVAVAKV